MTTPPTPSVKITHTIPLPDIDRNGVTDIIRREESEERAPNGPVGPNGVRKLGVMSQTVAYRPSLQGMPTLQQQKFGEVVLETFDMCARDGLTFNQFRWGLTRFSPRVPFFHSSGQGAFFVGMPVTYPGATRPEFIHAFEIVTQIDHDKVSIADHKVILHDCKRVSLDDLCWLLPWGHAVRPQVIGVSIKADEKRSAAEQALHDFLTAQDIDVVPQKKRHEWMHGKVREFLRAQEQAKGPWRDVQPHDSLRHAMVAHWSQLTQSR